MSGESDEAESATQQLEAFVDETFQVARAGEGRASTLDVIASALVILSAVIAVTTVMAASVPEDLTGSQRGVIGAGGLAALITTMICSALFRGFSALVRNSSRSLELQALDSSLLD